MGVARSRGYFSSVWRTRSMYGIESAGSHRRSTHKSVRPDGSTDRVVMDAQLGRNGADLPVLGVEEAVTGHHETRIFDLAG